MSLKLSANAFNSPAFLRIILIIPLLLMATTGVRAQNDLDVLPKWVHYSDAPNSLYHHLASQAFTLLDQRSEKIKAISSLSDWQKRQKLIQETLTDVVGAFPDKTPLKAKITRVVNKDGYKVENIIYESQPGYFVTSALFIPDVIKDVRAPAIIYCSGHSDSGYRSYTNIILNLVKKGFVVFAFDPIGQGERLQYFNPEKGKSSMKWPAWEHSYTGAQLFITGNTLARNFIWDGIRAVDYLLTRKEVDQTRIGITGRSGGGTQSAYVAAFDDRIKAVAPENYITSFTRLIQARGVQDAEQNFMYGIQKGIDMADILSVRAPKPALVITTTQDMFPIQGSIETVEEVSRIYKAYGKPENFTMVSDDAPHASTKKNREAMYAFFQKELNNPGNSSDEKTQGLSDEELQVTETGQVSVSLKSETAFSLNNKDAEKRMDKLEIRRKNPSGNTEVLRLAKELSGYREPEMGNAAQFLGRFQKEGYVVEKYLLKGEGNYVIPYLLLRPATPNGKALIYLNPEGKSADAAAGGEIEWFVKNGITVLAPDIVGTGEVGPGIFRGDSYIDSVSYNLWFTSMVVNRSIVGIQAGDVIRLTNQLKKDSNVKEIFGLAKRQLAPVLLHAAAFDKNISRVALIKPYSSYRSVAMSPKYDQSFLHSIVPASIGIYDLPDLAASLAPRKLIMVGVTDGNGSSANVKDINEDLSVINLVYENNAAKQLRILPATNTAKELYDIYKNWIEE